MTQTALSDHELQWYYSYYEALCVTRNGTEWERFVSDFMHALHGDRFVQVDASGRGDRGCDGYVDGMMMACYGAKSPNDAYVKSKIEGDVGKALTYWGKQMESWAFVHNNAEGLPKMAADVFISLRRTHSDKVKLKLWPPQVLWDEAVSKLTRQQFVRIFGAPPTSQPPDMSYIAQCVRALARQRMVPSMNRVSEVPQGKIEHNRFGDVVAGILIDLQVHTDMVAYYFRQSPPGEKTQVIRRLQLKYDGLRALTPSSSDAIFHGLCEFLVREAFGDGHSVDVEQERQAARLIVAHFFELCLLFEEPGEAIASTR